MLVLGLVTPLLTGCVSQPSTELTARRGDLAQVQLVLADGDDLVLPADLAANVTALCGEALADLGPDGCPQAQAPYVLLGSRPAHLPDDFADARGLPDPIVEVIEGMREGQHRFAQDVQAWGPHRGSLVEEHDRTQRLARIVDDSQAYGRQWNGTHTDNGSFEIQPREQEMGASLSVPEWCNERFCLFTSTLVNWTDTHLVVEHDAQPGDRVHVRSLDTFLTVSNASQEAFTVDGNDPRAGERFDVYAHLEDLRGPPEGQRRAPSFELKQVGGGSIALDEMLGRPVVIEFFATWCPSCRENAEHLARVAHAFGEDVAIVSIDVDPWESTEAIRSFIDAHNVTWPVAVDEKGEVSNAYSVGTLSTEVIVDAHGTIRHVETGVADHERVVDILAHLVEQASQPGHTTDEQEAREASGHEADPPREQAGGRSG